MTARTRPDTSAGAGSCGAVAGIATAFFGKRELGGQDSTKDGERDPMLCKKCPHHVRHGQVGADGKTIEFKNRCGLKMRGQESLDCKHFPFASGFDYTACDYYLHTFKTAGQLNDAIPTSDFQYSDKLATNSITEMELL
jgi:hypothetical protein